MPDSDIGSFAGQAGEVEIEDSVIYHKTEYKETTTIFCQDLVKSPLV